MSDKDTRAKVLRDKVKGITLRVLLWGRDRLPAGVRSLVGVLFMIGGVFGFLPVLGFWMIPLGGALIALDLPFTRTSINAWITRLEAETQDPS